MFNTQLPSVSQLQERLSEVEQERDVLKENNEKLINRWVNISYPVVCDSRILLCVCVCLRSALDVSQQQKWRLREQELKLQVAQLETALQADLVDKNQILDKIQVERGESQDSQDRKLGMIRGGGGLPAVPLTGRFIHPDANEKLKEENQKLHIQFLEQQQQLEEFRIQQKFSSTVRFQLVQSR